MSFWSRLFSSKSSDARAIISVGKVGTAQFSQRNFESFSREGYQKNVIAFRAISGVSTACAGIQWTLKKRKRELEEHPLLDLLMRPNPMQGQGMFFESLVAFYCISGNTYIESVGPSPKAPPLELWVHRPDRMKILAGSLGLPGKYVYSIGGNSKSWDVDQITGKSAILQIKTFNPTDDWYGMSPIEAAMYAVDQHNEAGRWNLSLLQNSAQPSGAFMVKTDAGNANGQLTQPQFENLKRMIDDGHSGARNAGRPMLLEGGLDWKQMSLSPKDMDWIDSKNTSARDISLAFGYPPLLLNIPGDNTFANYKEARMAFYEDTVLPLMDRIRDEFNNSITPAFGDELRLDYDRDDIEALSPKREAKFKMVNDANFLSINEKREALDYEPTEGGDVVLVASGMVPLEDAGAQPEPSPAPQPNDPKPAPTDETPPPEDQGKALEIKQINLLNGKEKASAWRRLNARREGSKAKLAAELELFFVEQAKDLAAATKDIDPKLADFAVSMEVSKGTAKLKTIIARHLKNVVSDFGKSLLDSGKGICPDETKAKSKFDQAVQHFVDTRSAEAVTQIDATSTKKARAVVREVLSEGIEEGDANREIANRLQEKFTDLSQSRADTIARTEVTIASTRGSLEAAKSLEIPGLKKEWVSIDDSRSRGNEPKWNPDHPNHVDMNGVRENVDEKFTVPPDASMDGPGDPAAGADQVINCILPGQLVSGYFVAGIKSKYVGPVFEFQTKSGQVLTVTANHPIATEQGLVPACEVREGNNFIANSGKVGPGTLSDNYVKNKPALIENVFHALHIHGNALRTNLLANDLHGDARFVESDVDIVASDGELLNWIKSRFDKVGKDFVLMQKNRTLEALSRKGSFESFNVRDFSSSASPPGCFQLPLNERGAFLDSLPFDGLSFGLSPEMDTFLMKLSLNSSTINTKFFGDLVNRSPRLVEFDPVIKVRDFNYSGHVYDLQSNTGLMQVGRIVTSNCRCVLVYTRG